MSQSDNWRKFNLSILFSMITFLYYCIQHIQRLDLLPYYSCKLDQELEILTSERCNHSCSFLSEEVKNLTQYLQ